MFIGDIEMIAFLKLWIFIALIVWVFLLIGWDWAKIMLGVTYVTKEKKWVEKEPSYLDAAWFALAWPFLLCSLVGFFITYLLSRVLK